jgi:hypothetical protein
LTIRGVFLTAEVRELKRDEFSFAEKLWDQYRGQKADLVNERICGDLKMNSPEYIFQKIFRAIVNHDAKGRR